MPNLIPFITYVVFTTFTPGPNNIMTMTNTMHHGYRKTLGFMAGISAGFCLVLWLCGLGNMLLVGLVPAIKPYLNILGAAYMVYLALHILFSKANEGKPGSLGSNTFAAGFGMQFLNVKVILYGVTVYSTFIVQNYQDPLTVSLFAPVLALVGIMSINTWAIGGNLFRGLFIKYQLPFNIVMEALLVYTAAASLVH
ncbi:MAG: LysE family transporter [Chloroflexota bacterium]